MPIGLNKVYRINQLIMFFQIAACMLFFKQQSDVLRANMKLDDDIHNYYEHLECRPGFFQSPQFSWGRSLIRARFSPPPAICLTRWHFSPCSESGQYQSLISGHQSCSRDPCSMFSHSHGNKTQSWKALCLPRESLTRKESWVISIEIMCLFFFLLCPPEENVYFSGWIEGLDSAVRRKEISNRQCFFSRLSVPPHREDVARRFSFLL